MPAQKRSFPSSAEEEDLRDVAAAEAEVEQIPVAAEEEVDSVATAAEKPTEKPTEKTTEKTEPVLQRCDEKRAGSDEEDVGSPSKDEYIQVKLADIRKEVQCPICLGIIRKTRTVMECLHRFCRECIDKSMRLGNNECPACRTHCASRRSLRDDPKYDALIAALYPNIDKYEAEELAFHDEENNRNKKIQASIAETLRRQTEALGKRRPTSRPGTAAGSTRKPVPFRRGRRPTGMVSDDEDDDADVNDILKDSSSADEPEPRPKRFKGKPKPRLSPALGASSTDGLYDENEDAGGKETRGASPGLVGNREVLVWGKGGARSQTRHGSGSATNGKNTKLSRTAKLVDYLRNLDEKENEYDMHLTLVPLDKETVPGLERPYLCCRPTLSIKHICQFIAHETSIQAEEIEILVRKPRVDTSPSVNNPVNKGQVGILEDELQILEAQESLSCLHDSFSSTPGDLVLVYRAKT